VLFMRETGELQRGGLAEFDLHGHGVWDGRFEIRSSRPLRIIALAGHATSLPVAERQALRRVPARARGGLPIAIAPDGAVTCPLLGSSSEVLIRSLAHERLLAACGVIVAES
jgi:tRNA(Ile)-lysidine synthase